MPDLILGATLADHVTTVTSGALRVTGPAVCTVWDAPTGGTQLDVVVDGVTVDSFRLGSTGRVPRFLVATVDGVYEVWLQIAGVAERYRLTGGQPGPQGAPGAKGDTGEIGPPGDSTLQATSYVYDALGRVTSSTEGGVTTAYTYEVAEPTAVRPKYRVRTDTRLGVTRRWWYTPQGQVAGKVIVTGNLADDFNRTDGNLAGTTTSIGGVPWVRVRDVSNVEAVIASGTAKLTGTTGSNLYATVVPASAGGCWSFQVAALAALPAVRMAIVTRYVDLNNHVSVMLRNAATGPGISVRVMVAGTSTYPATKTLDLAVGDVVRVDDNPFTGELTIHRNGTPLLRLVVPEHKGTTRGGFHGNRADVISAFDNFAWSQAA